MKIRNSRNQLHDHLYGSPMRQVAARIEDIPDLRVQSNVAASAGILAGLKLEKDFISQILRRELMQQSVIYQEWKEEFLQEGREAEATALVSRQLKRRLQQDMSDEMQTRLAKLPLADLEDLSEALLDFTTLADLEGWLEER